MVLECLRGGAVKDLTGYLCKALCFPLRSLHCDSASDQDNFFSELKTQIHNPSLHERVRRDWISDDIWVSIDARVTACREGAQQTARQLIL